MKKISLFRVIGAILFLTVTSSCTTVKDQLEYSNAPYRQYNFGKNDEISIQLPIPVLGEQYYCLYSNYLRWEWIGGGFANYFPISRLKIVSESIDKGPENMVSIQLNSGPDDRFVLFREIVVIIKGTPIVTTLSTSMYEGSPYSKAMIDRFIAEDNALFMKVLESVRVKENGKFYKIKVDVAKLADKMKEISFKPNRPSDLFEIPYRLIEEEAVVPVVQSPKT